MKSKISKSTNIYSERHCSEKY